MTSVEPENPAEIKPIEIMQRVTTRYHQDEDRLSLTGELASGNCRLWLTARLLRRVLPRLIQWLDGHSARQPHAEAMQRWAQEQAVVSLVPAVPVLEPRCKRSHKVSAAETMTDAVPEGAESDAPLRIWLAASVTLQFGPERVLLTWPGPEGMPAVRLPLGVDALRQWLHILYTQCELGEWSGLAWPAWLKPLPASVSRALQ